MSAFGECPHWAEVEAASDGRFGPREVDRVQRHLAQCDRCRADRDRLEAHRTEARSLARAPVSEMHRHRARAALLRAAVHAEEPHRGRRLVAVFAVAVAAVVFGLGTLRRASPPPPEPRAQVDVLANAQWSRTHTATLETVRLSEGSLRVRVPHQRAGHRFVVALPDGELEVRGTQFVVEARGGRTQRVTVFEGLVALRVGGGPEQLIAAGGHWQPTSSPHSTPVLAATTTVVDTPSPRPESPAPAPSATRRPPVQHPTAPAPSTGFEFFAAGVEAMGRGDFGTAAEAFARFEREQPGDERAEDAAWLRVVALRRSGDEVRALAAAERYLESYLTGAHRPEAATLCARAAIARGDCTRVEALCASEGTAANAVELRRLRDRCASDAGAR